VAPFPICGVGDSRQPVLSERSSSGSKSDASDGTRGRKQLTAEVLTRSVEKNRA